MTLESPFELWKSYSPGKQLRSLTWVIAVGEIHEGETGFKEVRTQQNYSSLKKGEYVLWPRSIEHLFTQ